MYNSNSIIKMKKNLLLIVFSFLLAIHANGQTENVWQKVKREQVISLNQNVTRATFPNNFLLYKLDLEVFKNVLIQAQDRFVNNPSSVIITLPTANGAFERFQMLEASNFDAELQDQFPQIRAYIGKSLSDPKSILRLSISPSGIQTMTIRPNGLTEFMEPYSSDNSVYAVFTAKNRKGKLPFTCSTEDQEMTTTLFNKTRNTGSTNRSDAQQLLNFRLALSCNGEYANYFGATSSTQVSNVLAAFNNTMTRVNGVFEKDFCIKMTIVSQTTNVIYYSASTDPYTTMANWNVQLQNTLSTSLTGPGTSLAANNAAYDVGHMFGRTGGGGNAGCIGCVCVDDTASTTDRNKGAGITSPADGIPAGDTFDIDYVAHEMGHQFGANHTFSNSVETAGVNVEVGSGSTIMGYAGITDQDVQMHSDPYFHYASIFQVQNNMEGKTCPTRTNISNAAPVANAGINYTIPKSTPFILSGTATDANSTNVLTYCWEQIDNATSAVTAANSVASETKTVGPNWRSYSPVSSGIRYCPPIDRVIDNFSTTDGTGDEIIVVEALSSVARTLTFALTVRDNVAGFGQTSTDAMSVTVNGTAGPFLVSSPNTAVNWQVGTNQTVTWDVAGTTANGVNCANVDLYLSTDGGYTYPVLLASGVPNDGSETITIPNNIGTQNRIMVKGSNHIFYDISNTNFTISAPSASFSLAYSGIAGGQTKSVCQGNSTSFPIQYTALAGFSGITSFSVTGAPANTTATFSPSSVSSNGTVTVNISTANNATVGNYTLVVTGTSGSITRTVNLYLNVVNGNFGTQTLISPTNLANGLGTSVVLSWNANIAASSYEVQVASNPNFSTIVASGTVTGSTTVVSGLSLVTTYWWRVLPKNSGCSGTYSAVNQFTTGESNCNYNYSNNTVLTIPDGTGANTAGTTVTKTISVPGSVAGFLNGVNVNVDFTHTYIEDLIIELQHPDGTTVKLWDRNCDNEFPSVSFTFSDGNPSIPSSNCTASSGTFSPSTPLSVLNGKSASGNWTLKATDWYNGDTGSIGNWSINLCMSQIPLSNERFGLENFSIYPNPNNGDFTVNFTSESSNPIEIMVHDIRGREVYTKSFSNSSLFNQTIQLSNVETGIYLVTVKDGERKEVKKIIIE